MQELLPAAALADTFPVVEVDYMDGRLKDRCKHSVDFTIWDCGLNEEGDKASSR